MSAKIYRIYATPGELLCTCMTEGTAEDALGMIRAHEWLGPQLGEGCCAVEAEEVSE